MALFNFIAKDRMGNSINGKLAAADLTSAANQIGQMGYSLVDIVETFPATLPAVNATEHESTTPSHSTLQPLNPVSPAVIPMLLSDIKPDSTLERQINNEAVSSSESSGQSKVVESDLLLTDEAKRRKLETDLSKMGMKPEEIRRLINADAKTTLPAAKVELSSSAVTIPVQPLDNTKNKKTAVIKKRDQQASELHSFAAQLAASNSSARTIEIDNLSLELPEFRESTQSERQKADGFLREAFAFRRRERYKEALVKCREALNLVPSDASALEMLGDLYQGVAQTNEALAAYKRALEADSKRTSAEKKYGDLISRQKSWSNYDPEAVPKNPWFALILSILFPGFGQLHNGQRVKGIVLAGFTILCIGVWFTLASNLNKPVPDPMPKRTTNSSKQLVGKREAEITLLVSQIFYITLSLYSAIDSFAFASKMHKN